MIGRSISLVLLAATIVCSCSDDHIAQESENLIAKTENGVLYLSVKLKDIDSESRGEDAGYSEAANAYEKEIRNVAFYFYDSNGIFMAQASYTNGGDVGNTLGSKVDYDSDNKSYVITVGNISAHPMAMLTVINPPSYYLKNIDGEQVPAANFVGYSSIRDMRTILAEQATDEDGYLTMSTATYFNNAYDTTNYPYNFYTTLAADNFKEQYDDAAKATPLEITVERVEAKVNLSLSNKIALNTSGFYPLSDLAGNPVKLRDVTTVQSSKVYLKFLGWGVNAQTGMTYVFRNLNPIWSPITSGGTSLSFTWNDVSNNRCYWAASYNYYDKTNGFQTDNADFSYPLGYASVYDATNTKQLKYYDTTHFNSALNSDIYCFENTNTADVVNSNYSSITSAVLLTQLVDESGNSLGNVVYYNGMLFREQDYLDYVMNYFTGVVNLNFSYKESDGTVVTINSQHVELSPSYEVSNGKYIQSYNGQVYVQLKQEYRDKTWYPSSACTGTAVKVQEINASLKTFNANYDTYCMTDGKAYYNIPIEHLGKSGQEGQYGIVRNCYYQIEITSINNIGHPIYDETEPIIPQEEDKTNYYIGTTFNVLSWKNIKQSLVL